MLGPVSALAVRSAVDRCMGGSDKSMEIDIVILSENTD